VVLKSYIGRGYRNCHVCIAILIVRADSELTRNGCASSAFDLESCALSRAVSSAVTRLTFTRAKSSIRVALRTLEKLRVLQVKEADNKEA
jgi:hypothetical protein